MRQKTTSLCEPPLYRAFEASIVRWGGVLENGILFDVRDDVKISLAMEKNICHYTYLLFASVPRSISGNCSIEYILMLSQI